MCSRLLLANIQYPYPATSSLSSSNGDGLGLAADIEAIVKALRSVHLEHLIECNTVNDGRNDTSTINKLLIEDDWSSAQPSSREWRL